MLIFLCITFLASVTNSQVGFVVAYFFLKVVSSFACVSLVLLLLNRPKLVLRYGSGDQKPTAVGSDSERTARLSFSNSTGERPLACEFLVTASARSFRPLPSLALLRAQSLKAARALRCNEDGMLCV